MTFILAQLLYMILLVITYICTSIPPTCCLAYVNHDINLVTGYMPTELMFAQKLIMPVERTISSWMEVDWTEEMS